MQARREAATPPCAGQRDRAGTTSDGPAVQEAKQSARTEARRPAAQSDPLRPHEEIVVTATLVPRQVKDIAASVGVITARDLRFTTAPNALAALDHLPGVFVRRTGVFGRADADIRGLGDQGRRIAVLVDGRPEKQGLFGCAVSHAFPLDNVDRIEVVRGPASVLYGSEALGGVVNIFTRPPTATFEGEVTASYGSFDTRQWNLRMGGDRGGWGWSLTYDRRDSDGHIVNSRYAGDAWTARVDVRPLEPLEISFQGKFFDARKDEPGPVEAPVSGLWNDYQRGAADITAAARFERDEIQAKAYRNFGDHVFSDGWRSRDVVDGARLAWTTHRLSRHTLTTGAEFRSLSGKRMSAPAGEWDRTEAALFVHDEQALFDRLLLTLGVRLHRDSITGFEFAPQAGLVLPVGVRTTLRAAAGRGFRSPQLNELYLFPSSNPNLRSERVTSAEAGFERRFGDGFSLSGTAFVMRGRGLIEALPNSSPPPMMLFQNAESFLFKGVETEARLRLSTGLDAAVSYTWLDPGEKTKGRPRHKADVSLAARTGPLEASLQVQGVTDYFAANDARNRLPAYVLLNSRLIWRLSPALEGVLDVGNILDAAYRIYVELPGLAAGSYLMPGRSLNIGLRVRM